VGLFVVFEELFIDEILIGWLLSFFNHVTQWFATQLNRAKGTMLSFSQCLCLNMLRVLVFLLMVSFVIFLTELNTMPFVYALLGTYFIFLTYHVVSVHYASLA
jgi:hypothetical protein